MNESPVNLLLIEDDEPFRKMLSVSLRRAGFVVQEARNTAGDYLRIAPVTGAHRVLAKPFLPGERIQLVREVMAEPVA